jgi:hypothetical protein
LIHDCGLVAMSAILSFLKTSWSCWL